MSDATSRRRFLVPEVIQTSSMDCGPACLKSLLEGFGVAASYGRLREACQTEVDGTSIDTIEEIACQLGADAEQIIAPVDHVLLNEADALPGIAVVRMPDGNNHFIILWRKHGPLVQVMDPSTGRRWVSTSQLTRDLYVHEMELDAQGWREWAGDDDFLLPLRRRLRRVGVRGDELTQAALQDSGWRSLARLDAATRMVFALIDAHGIARGRHAAQLLRSLLDTDQDGGELIPERYWSALASDDAATLRVRGAVLIRVGGVRAPSADSERSSELSAALEEPDRRPGREIRRLLSNDGALGPSILLAGFAMAAAGLVIEALLFRGLFDIGRHLGAFEQRVGAAVALLIFMAALLCVEIPLASGVQRLGRQLEARLRVAFLEKLPRIAVRYFRSRPTSDMAERSHAIHRVRELPMLGGHLARVGFEIVLTTAGLVWLAPETAPLAIALGAVVLVVPVLAQKPLMERELRVRTHGGALSRFYLDALLGVIPVRTHGVERAMRREHEGLLVEWARAGLSAQRVAVITEAVQAFAALGLAAWLVIHSITASAEPASLLLLVYWALTLPLLAQEIGVALRELPTHRNLTLRLLEPLGAIENDAASAANDADPVVTANGGVSIDMREVEVRAAGHTLLADLTLTIDAGEHVAIVGASGAGKSTLVGLLLGWMSPSRGELRVDSEPLTSTHLTRLRRETAWVDPSVHLWNRSLTDNLRYGAEESNTVAMADAIGISELDGILPRLPNGMQTELGEGGCLVSGGEGQRVRFGRALYRPGARLVILDEPFRGLDRDHRGRLLRRARDYWKQATLLCITHDIEATLGFDRVIVIADGRVIEDGVPATLARSESALAELLEAERSVAARWAIDDWRRMQMVNGRPIETKADSS